MNDQNQLPPTEEDIPATEPDTGNGESQDPRGRLSRLNRRLLFFGAIALLALIMFAISRMDALSAFLGNLVSICSPLIIGCVIAYLCNPILNFYEYRAFHRLRSKGLRRGLSLLMTFLTALGAVAAVLLLIIPELLNSLREIVNNYDVYLNRLLAFVQSAIDVITANIDVEIDISDVDKLTTVIENVFGSVDNALIKLLNRLESMTAGKDLISNLWGGIMKIVSTFMDVLIGLFIAFYILASREKRFAQIRKFRKAYFTDKTDQRVTEVVTLVDKTFGGFIKGMLLDAVAVGIVTFILMTLFSVSEYNLLIAAICAVTNIIPVFGPFIGAIPAGLIVLISNPSRFFVFVVLIVIIQQIDGNIIYPRIQGNNTGISSLAVLSAITIMGSLWGVGGLILGVPLFAVVIELVKRSIDKRLVAIGEPTDTTNYYSDNAVGNADEEVHYEHSHWLYKYDHSRLKVRIDNARNALRARFCKCDSDNGESDGESDNQTHPEDPA